MLELFRTYKYPTWTVDVVDHFGVQESHSFSSHCCYVFELFRDNGKVTDLDCVSDSLNYTSSNLYYKSSYMIVHETAVVIRQAAIGHLANSECL
jgi:hypothetical protein